MAVEESVPPSGKGRVTAMVRAAAAEETDWTAVIGRSLAFLCLHYADMEENSMTEKADFLKGLGLPRKDAASVLGSGPAPVICVLV